MVITYIRLYQYTNSVTFICSSNRHKNKNKNEFGLNSNMQFRHAFTINLISINHQ